MVRVLSVAAEGEVLGGGQFSGGQLVLAANQ